MSNKITVRTEGERAIARISFSIDDRGYMVEAADVTDAAALRALENELHDAYEAVRAKRNALLAISNAKETARDLTRPAAAGLGAIGSGPMMCSDRTQRTLGIIHSKTAEWLTREGLATMDNFHPDGNRSVEITDAGRAVLAALEGK